MKHFETVCHSGERHITVEKNDVHLRINGVELETAPWPLESARKLGVETVMHNEDVDWTGQTDVSDISDILTSREETS